MQGISSLQAEVTTLWPECSRLSWAALTPDGSDRTYYRLQDQDSSKVLMVYRGENATSLEDFLEVHRLLEDAGLPVPRIYKTAPEAQLVLQEDLGSTSLESVLQTASPEKQKALLEEALESLFKMQRIQPEDSSASCFALRFDREKLRFEMDFFLQKMVQDFLKLDLSASQLEGLQQELDALCEFLARETPVLCHRDFHCRNLMVHQGRLRWIDYQDARLGRASYDLVSLLYDAYFDPGPQLRAQLLGDFLLASRSLGLVIEAEEIVPMAIQRLLKALGSFGYLMGEKEKLHFGASIFQALDSLGPLLQESSLPRTRELLEGPVQEACHSHPLLKHSGPSKATP